VLSLPFLPLSCSLPDVTHSLVIPLRDNCYSDLRFLLLNLRCVTFTLRFSVMNSVTDYDYGCCCTYDCTFAFRCCFPLLFTLLPIIVGCYLPYILLLLFVAHLPLAFTYIVRLAFTFIATFSVTEFIPVYSYCYTCRYRSICYLICVTVVAYICTLLR